MAFFPWLQSRILGQSTQVRLPRRSPSPRLHPRLEVLEDRSLPTTYYASTPSDLIAAMTSANRHGGANTILLSAPAASPYIFSATNNSKLGNTVLPAVVAGDNLTIRTENGSPDPQYGDTLDASHYGRLFIVNAGASLTLQNVTLKGGLVYGENMANGGAIENMGTLDVNHVMIEDNEALGNLYIPTYKKAPTGYNAAGGGIWSNGTLTVENQTWVLYNQVIGVGTGSGFGGGICVAGGTATISNTTLGSNPWTPGGENTALGGYDPSRGTYNGYGPGSGYGGGLYVGSGTATLTNDFVAWNWAGNYIDMAFDGFIDPGYGGGIYIAPAATVYIDSFTVGHTFNNFDWYSYYFGGNTANIDGAYSLLP